MCWDIDSHVSDRAVTDRPIRHMLCTVGANVMQISTPGPLELSVRRAASCGTPVRSCAAWAYALRCAQDLLPCCAWAAQEVQCAGAGRVASCLQQLLLSDLEAGSGCKTPIL